MTSSVVRCAALYRLVMGGLVARRWATSLLLGALLALAACGAVCADDAQSDALRRLPVPAEEDLLAAERNIRELFADEFKQKGAIERAALAQKLLELGGKTTNDPASRYICWRESRDLAVQAIDVATAMDAIQQLSDHFVFDGLAEKVKALAQAGRSARSAEARVEVARGHLLVAAQACSVDDYKSAKSAASAAMRLSRKAEAPNLSYKSARVLGQVEELQKQYANIPRALSILGTDPSEGDANLAVGNFRCFVKQDWDAGLALLRKCSDDRLALVALADDAKSAQAADLVNLGDMWWSLAQGGAKYADAYKHRALEIYERALPQLVGLDKARVDKRIEDYWRSAGWQDALSIIDPELDRFRGEWFWSDKGLTSSPKSEAVILSPAAPSGSYELKVQFTRKKGREAVYVDFPVADTIVHVAVSGWAGKFGGLLQVDGKDYRYNETKVSPSKIKNGRRYQFLIRVTVAGESARIEVDFDGAPFVRWEGKHSRLGIRDAPRKDLIILGSWQSETLFHRAEVRMTAGKFRIVERPVKK